MTIRPLIVGTRGSALALIQANFVVNALRACRPDQEFQLQVIRTLGDRQTRVPLSAFPTTGVFVKEIDRLLLDRAIDLAVHSLKDVPPDENPSLVLAAFPERVDPRDVLVSGDGTPFRELPVRARVGTSSVRRQAQLRAIRPDLTYCDDLRGNVDTRLRKLHQGDYAAIVLAAAGMIRLGRAAEITEYLPLDVCLPDAGQGILAVEARGDDRDVVDLLALIDDGQARAAALAERAVLQAFGGGCKVPVAAHAQIDGPDLHLTALVALPDGSRIIRSTLAGPTTDAVRLGQELWEQLRAVGASELLVEASGG